LPFCTKCGSEFAAGVRFCPSCGASVSMSAASGPVAKPPAKPSHTKRNILVGVIVVLVVLIGMAAAGHLLNPTTQTGTELATASTTPTSAVLQTTSQPPTTAAGTQYDVVIKYTEKYTNSIGGMDAKQGYTFLIMTVQIQNNGDREFSTNALDFYVVINNIKYSADFSGFSLSDSIQSVELQKGGTISGSIAFQVPVATTDYTPTYEAPFSTVEINWIHY